MKKQIRKQLKKVLSVVMAVTLFVLSASVGFTVSAEESDIPHELISDYRYEFKDSEEVVAIPQNTDVKQALYIDGTDWYDYKAEVKGWQLGSNYATLAEDFYKDRVSGYAFFKLQADPDDPDDNFLVGHRVATDTQTNNFGSVYRLNHNGKFAFLKANAGYAVTIRYRFVNNHTSTNGHTTVLQLGYGSAFNNKIPDDTYRNMGPETITKVVATLAYSNDSSKNSFTSTNENGVSTQKDYGVWYEETYCFNTPAEFTPDEYLGKRSQHLVLFSKMGAGARYEIDYIDIKECAVVKADLMGGKGVSIVSGAADEAISLTDPTRDGYDFAGWYTDRKCTTVFTQTHFNSDNEIINVYAKWTEQYATKKVDFFEYPIDTFTNVMQGGAGGTFSIGTSATRNYLTYRNDSGYIDAQNPAYIPLYTDNGAIKLKSNTDYIISFDYRMATVDGKAAKANINFFTASETYATGKFTVPSSSTTLDYAWDYTEKYIHVSTGTITEGNDALFFNISAKDTILYYISFGYFKIFEVTDNTGFYFAKDTLNDKTYQIVGEVGKELSLPTPDETVFYQRDGWFNDEKFTERAGSVVEQGVHNVYLRWKHVPLNFENYFHNDKINQVHTFGEDFTIRDSGDSHGKVLSYDFKYVPNYLMASSNAVSLAVVNNGVTYKVSYDYKVEEAKGDIDVEFFTAHRNARWSFLNKYETSVNTIRKSEAGKGWKTATVYFTADLSCHGAETYDNIGDGLFIGVNPQVLDTAKVLFDNITITPLEANEGVVVFLDKNGNSFETVQGEIGTAVSAPETVPYDYMSQFSGWNTGGISITPVAKDALTKEITVTGDFTRYAGLRAYESSFSPAIEVPGNHELMSYPLVLSDGTYLPYVYANRYKKVVVEEDYYKFLAPAATLNFFVNSEKIPYQADPTATYKISFEYKTKSTRTDDKTFIVGLGYNEEMFNAEGAITSESPASKDNWASYKEIAIPANTETNWTPIEFELTLSGQNSTKIEPLFGIGNGYMANADYYVKNIVVEKVGAENNQESDFVYKNDAAANDGNSPKATYVAGNSIVKQETLTIGEPYTPESFMLDESYIPEGYYFTGWHTKADFSGVNITRGVTVVYSDFTDGIADFDGNLYADDNIINGNFAPANTATTQIGELKDNTTYLITYDYTAGENGFVSFFTADANDKTKNASDAEEFKFALDNTASAKQGKVLFTTGFVYTAGEEGYGDNLYITLSGGATLDNLTITAVDLLSAQGSAVLTDQVAEDANHQALRYFFGYKSHDSASVVINGETYTLIERGIAIKNANNIAAGSAVYPASVKKAVDGEFGYTRKGKTYGFKNCWEYKDGEVVFSNYVKGFKLTDKRITSARGYLVLRDANGNEFTVYSAPENTSVTETKAVLAEYTDTKKHRINGTNWNRYTIVHPRIMSYVYGEKIEELVAFAASRSVSLPSLTDDSAVKPQEIVIGDTTRAVSAQVTVTESDSYIIKVIDGKVVIKGGSDIATRQALTDFMAMLNRKEELGCGADLYNGFVMTGKYEAKYSDYALTFGDEFDGEFNEYWYGNAGDSGSYEESSIDGRYVTSRGIGGSKVTLANSGETKEMVTIRDGSAVLGTAYMKPTTEKDIAKNASFVDSNLSTYGKMLYQYGMLEFKVKLAGGPTTNGLWVNGEVGNNSGPYKRGCFTEYDMLENFGDRSSYSSNLHYWWDENRNGDEDHIDLATQKLLTKHRLDYYPVEGETDMTDDYHIFTLIWTDKGVKFAFDGVSYCTYTSPDWYKEAMPNYIIVSAGMGDASYGPKYDVENDPEYQETLFDYVRLYQVKDMGAFIYDVENDRKY